MGQLRARRKAAKMLVAVVVMFAVCYFPVHLLSILRYAIVGGLGVVCVPLQRCNYIFVCVCVSNRLTLMPGQSEMATVLSLISHWLCYANSAINPVIYNFMSGELQV